MLNVTPKKQHAEKNRKQFLLFFIALLSMMSLLAQCPPVNVPYIQNFESASIPDMPSCTSIESTGDGGDWGIFNYTGNGFSGKYLRYGYSINEAGNAWFFTRGINLTANTTYKITYDYGRASEITNKIENLRVAYGTSASSEGMTSPLANHPSIAHGSTPNSVNFTPAASGVYYFGFNAYSMAYQGYLCVDNIKVEATTTPPASGTSITNFTSSTNCGPSTLLTINGTNLANATVKIGGTPVTLATNTATQITANISTAMSGPVVVTTASGTATGTSNFTFMLSPVLTLNGTTSTICAGGESNKVLLTSVASNYTTYTWAPYTGVTGNSINGWFLSPATSTTYVLNASNPATGCTNSVNYAIVVTPSPATPVITASSALAMCEGSNLTLTSSATSGNVWSTNATTNSITVTTGGSYTVTVTQNGCSVTSVPAVVTVVPKPATPVITAPSPLTMCEGNNLVLTSSATSGNVWSTNATTNSITVTTGGSYTVTVTQNGCSTTSAPAVVTVIPKPVAVASLTSDVKLTATPAGQTYYQWINCTTNAPVSGATGATFTAPANGSYKVIVTNAGGCKDTSACVNVSKVGLDENSVDIGVSLYPNPTEGNVYITITETEKADVTVLDAQGKVVLTMNNIQDGTVIDMNHTQKGIYLVKVSNTRGTNVFRMVKK